MILLCDNFAEVSAHHVLYFTYSSLILSGIIEDKTFVKISTKKCRYAKVMYVDDTLIDSLE